MTDYAVREEIPTPSFWGALADWLLMLHGVTLINFGFGLWEHDWEQIIVFGCFWALGVTAFWAGWRARTSR